MKLLRAGVALVCLALTSQSYAYKEIRDSQIYKTGSTAAITLESGVVQTLNSGSSIILHSGATLTAQSGSTVNLTGATVTGLASADADIVSLAGATTNGKFYYRFADGDWRVVTIGANLSFASGTLSATSGTLSDGPHNEILSATGGADLQIDPQVKKQLGEIRPIIVSSGTFTIPAGTTFARVQVSANLTLPAVGAGSTQEVVGGAILLRNESGTPATVRNASGSVIGTVSAGTPVRFRAVAAGTPDTWTLEYNPPSPSLILGTTNQPAANTTIALATGLEFKFTNGGTTLFSLRNDTGSVWKFGIFGAASSPVPQQSGNIFTALTAYGWVTSPSLNFSQLADRNGLSIFDNQSTPKKAGDFAARKLYGSDGGAGGGYVQWDTGQVIVKGRDTDEAYVALDASEGGNSDNHIVLGGISGNNNSFEVNGRGDINLVDDEQDVLLGGDGAYKLAIHLTNIHGNRQQYWPDKTGSLQIAPLFQDEGSSLGAADGKIDHVNFIGAGVTAARSGDILSITIPGANAQVIYDSQSTPKKAADFAQRKLYGSLGGSGAGSTYFTWAEGFFQQIGVDGNSVFQVELDGNDDDTHIYLWGTDASTDPAFSVDGHGTLLLSEDGRAGSTITIGVDDITAQRDYFWPNKGGRLQIAPLFQDEGTSLGSPDGKVDHINFVGSRVTAARSSDTVTVTVAGPSASESITTRALTFGSTLTPQVSGSYKTTNTVTLTGNVTTLAAPAIDGGVTLVNGQLLELYVTQNSGGGNTVAGFNAKYNRGVTPVSWDTTGSKSIHVIYEYVLASDSWHELAPSGPF